MFVTHTCSAATSSSRPGVGCVAVRSRIRNPSETRFITISTAASARLASRDQRVSVVSRLGLTTTTLTSSAASTTGMTQRGPKSSRCGSAA